MWELPCKSHVFEEANACGLNRRHIFTLIEGMLSSLWWNRNFQLLICLQERIICLNGAVDEGTSASIVAQLLFLEADNPDKPISLYINSPGGSVTAGMATWHLKASPSRH